MTGTQADVGRTQHQGHPLVRVRGEVDMANAVDVGDRIRAGGDLSGPIVLDLEAVEFFDSSGLRMLQQLSDDVERAGGELTVVATPVSIVGRLLALTMMDTQIRVRSSLPGPA